MYDLIADNPYAISLLLAFCSLVSFGIWVKAGVRPAGIVGLLFLAGIPVFMWLEDKLVTDKEVLREMIEEMAQAVEAEDFDQIYKHIDTNASNALASAKSELTRYRFSDARITGYRDLKVRSDLNPSEALADFTAVAELEGPGTRTESIPRRVRLAFRKFGTEWKVIGFEHLPPVGKTDGFAGTGGEIPEWMK